MEVFVETEMRGYQKQTDNRFNRLIEDAWEKLEDLRRKLTTAQIALKAANSDLISAKNSLSNAQSSLTTTKSEYNNLSSSPTEEGKARAQLLREKIDSLERQASSYKLRVDKLTIEIADWEREIARLEAEIRTVEESIAQLGVDRQAANSDMEDLINNARTTDESYASTLQAANDAMRGFIDDVNKTRDSIGVPFGYGKDEPFAWQTSKTTSSTANSYLDQRNQMNEQIAKSTAAKAISSEEANPFISVAGSFATGLGAGIAESLSFGTSSILEGGYIRDNEYAYLAGKVVANTAFTVGGAAVALGGATVGVVTAPTGVGAVAGTGVAVAGGTVAVSSATAAFQNVATLGSMMGSSGGSNTSDPKKDGTPKSNQAQNKQVDEACKKYNLSKEGRAALHDEISGQNYSKDEVFEAAKEISEWGGKFIGKQPN